MQIFEEFMMLSGSSIQNPEPHQYGHIDSTVWSRGSFHAAKAAAPAGLYT